MTLIEITIALAIAAMVTATAVASINAITDANLRSSAVAMTGAMKQSYDRAVMLRRTQRLVIDMDNNAWWLDFTEDRFAVSREKLSGDKGDQLDGRGDDDDKERSSAARSRRSKSIFDDDVDPAVQAALEGGRATQFVPDEDTGAGKPTKLEGGVKFSKVWTGHQEEAFTGGLAYVYFWAVGHTEPAQIELMDEGEDTVTLVLSPLTGRVRTVQGSIDVPSSKDDDGRDEGDE